MAASEQKLNKIFDQNVEITGTLTVGGVSASPSSYLQLSGGTLTGKLTINISSGSIIGTGASSDAFGYNSNYGHYIAGNGGTYIYGNGSFYDGSTNRTLIHSGNIGSQSVNYASSAGSVSWSNVSGKPGTYDEAYALDIADTRAAQRMPTSVPEYRVSSEFTNQITSGWHSLINVKGWHDGYATWQLIGGSDTSTHENLYFRSGVNSAWGSLRTIIHSGNIGSYALTSLPSHTHDYISEGGTSFSGEYPMVVRVGSNNYYSHPNITFRGSDSTLTTGNLSVTGNTNLGNGNGDATRINDVLYVGASDSGNSSIIFGEDSSSWYGAHLYWDSGYRFTWYTRNAGTDTNLFHYDTNNTTYINWGRSHHLNNRNIDYVNQLHFNDNVRFYDDGNDNYLNFKAGDTGTTGIKFYNGNNQMHGYIYGDGGGANFGLLSADGSWGVRVTNSLVESYHEHRAPVYYDSNNTGYYLNPESTNRIFELYANDVTSTERQAAPRWDTAFYVLQAQHWYGDNNTQTMYLGEDNYIHLRDNVEITDDVRSPIYYDRNDTGYYLDPAGTSRLNAVNSVNDVVDGEILFAITDYDTTESIRTKFGGGTINKIDDGDAPASGVFEVVGSFNPTFGPYMPMGDDTEVTFECWAKHGSGSDTSGLLYAGSNFYDSNKSYYGNTQRYWGASSDAQDANDTGWRHIKGSFKGSTIKSALADASYFQFIVLFNYQSNGNTTRFCGFKYYKSNKTVTSLNIKRGSNDTAFQSSETASSMVHTVLDNNGNVNPYDAISMPYSGGGTMYFRTNSHWDSISGIDVIGGAGEFRFSSNAGNLNVRADGWMIAHEQMQAPLFYDLNDTTYYMDPNSTTRSGRLRGCLTFNDYGAGVTGTYTSTRLQTIFNMGESYKIALDGSSASGAYGLYWSHQNAGGLGGANNLASHGILIIENGSWKGAWGGGSLRTPGDARAPIFYDYNNTGYYADFASSSYSLFINGGIKFGSTNAESSGGFIGRHGSGGGLNTDAYPSPLYSIGDDYRPSGTGLSNHYGVGYAHTNASFYGLSGQSGWGFYVSADGDARVQLNGSNGTISCTGDVVAYASDGRLKENVKPIENALEKVMKIRGVSYDWVKNITEEYDFHPTKMHEVGVIAQEVQAVLPEVVTIAPFDTLYSQKTGWRKVQKQMESELGREVTKAEAKTEYEKLPIEEQESMQEKYDFLTVNYERLTALLIEAIKEQQKQIDELKKNN